MAKPNVLLPVIEAFLAHKRIAMIGISRERLNIGTSLLEEFTQHGYDVVPVNPNISEISGQRCYSRVQEIQPGVDAALLLTSPKVTAAVVRDCAEAGI